MIDRRFFGYLLCLFAVECKQHSDKSLASEHGPSEALLAHWNPPAQSSFCAYADLGSLLKTDIIQRMLTSALGFAKPSQDTLDCVAQISHASREAAAAGAEAGRFIVIMYDAQALKAPIETCIRLLGGESLRPIPDRAGVYELPAELLAVLPNALLLGSPALVESSLTQAAKGVWSKDLVLAKDRQLVFSSHNDKLDANANLAVSQSHFGVEARVKFSNEADAKTATEAASPASIESQVSELYHQNMGELTKQILEHWHVRREQNTVSYSFLTDGNPEQLASQVGTVSAVGIANLRRFIAAAKTAEARAAVRSIANHVIDSKPTWLESFPAVPASIEKVRGTKYQSLPREWLRWQSIDFLFGGPQYFQYRVDAAADGKSARAVAQGDLNGDGKLSSFSLLITLDPKTHESTAAREIEEHDPLE